MWNYALLTKLKLLNLNEKWKEEEKGDDTTD